MRSWNFILERFTEICSRSKRQRRCLNTVRHRTDSPWRTNRLSKFQIRKAHKIAKILLGMTADVLPLVLSSDMNKAPLKVSGPYTHENLTIFLFHSHDQIDGSRYISLKQAFEKKKVRVYETGTVGQLEAENLSETIDIFIQAGDVLKGGRQDRTLGIDFIIPARSGRLPIPTFCVESGRWHRRRGEDDRHFGCSSHSIHAKAMRLAAKVRRINPPFGTASLRARRRSALRLTNPSMLAHSPTSYQLSVEDPDLENRKRDYKQKLGRLPKRAPDVVGYSFYVNGERNSVDIYGSTKLFHQLWEKLLNIAILEAISAQNGKAAVQIKPTSTCGLNRQPRRSRATRRMPLHALASRPKHTKTALSSRRSTKLSVTMSFCTRTLSPTKCL